MSLDDTAERPRLAPGTWLVGRLDESALEHPPWAVERAKLGYVQMGELAYHVAEQVDGERTVEEIAAAVSAALDRPVGVADVYALIYTVLVPRGVVAGHADDRPLPDESRATAPAPRRIGRAVTGRPQARERVIGPAVLERIAAVLMWLFWPPVMLVLVGLALTALAWLFGLHGLAAGVVHALAEPILLPTAVVLALLVACLEPLGPLAALYGAGARIERLRVAVSLREPHVELDVAEDYGLSRWARLTVDASSVYLQLVAALLICVIGMVTGAEFLFLAVTLIALNSVRLLLPFGRPGADRLLADLLLVPEPLAYAGQELARRLTSDPHSIRELPPLKRWGWVTISTYLAVTGVVLILLGLVVLRATPAVTATILSALVVHVSDTIGALGERDMVGFFGGLFRAGMLALTSFLLAVAAIVAAGRLVMAGVAWGQASPGRRLTVGSCAVAGALVVVLFWVPIPRLGASASVTPRSLFGTTFRPLSPITRGAIGDLFVGPGVEEVPMAEPGDLPFVSNPVGSGVDQPAPDPSPGPR